MKKLPFTIGRRIAATCTTLTVALALAACGGTTAATTKATDAEAAALLPQAIKDAGVLNVGTYAPSPPTRMFKEDGTTLTGLDISLAEQIGQSLGLEVKFQNMKWDGLLPALKANRFDVVAAQVGDYTERRGNGDFVDYYTTGASAVALESSAGTFTDQWDMCGKRVGFQSGVAAAKALPELSKQCATKKPASGPMDLKPFPDDAAGLLALRSGQTDVHVLDNTAAAYQVQKSQSGTKMQIVASDLIERANIGMVIAKDNTKLRDAVEAALKNLLKSGRYQEILDQYGLGDYGVKAITVNTTERSK